MVDMKCERPECPGPEGAETGFGLAGGGYGAYTFCPQCFKIHDKWQENDLQADQSATGETEADGSQPPEK